MLRPGRFGAGPRLALLVALLASACQGSGESNPTRPRVTPGPAQAASPSPSPSGSPTFPSPALPLSPAPSLTPPPLSKPPSTAPTPTPSGFQTPLPPNAFPPDPSPTPTPSQTPTPSPSPLASPLPAEVLSNSLPQGTAALSGFVGDPNLQGGAAVGGATIRIRAKDMATGLPVPGQSATLRNAANGTFLVRDMALGTYFLDVTKEGYTSSTLPTEVTLDLTRPEGYTVLALTKTP